MNLFSSFFIALLVSMLMVPPLMRLAPWLGLVDVPDARKVHAGAIPRSGGIAIMFGALVPVLIWWPAEPMVRGLLIGALVIFIFGLLDDRKGLHYAWKFFGQFLAVAIVIAAGLRIKILPFFGIEPVSPVFSIALTAVFLVGVTNAINLSDGLDGLAAGISLIALAAIAWLFYQSQATGMALLSLAVLGGICGFLRYNNHPALVFMGDAGSQFLGFTTAVLAIVLTQHTNQALNPALLLLLLGLPILDTLTVMIWRLRRGRSPFLPDRNHFHHRLLDFGFYHYQAVSIIYVAQALLVGTAVLVRYEGDAMVVGVYVVFSVLVLSGFRLGRRIGLTARRARRNGDASERRNLLLRRFPRLPVLAARMTELLAAGFLLFAAVYPAQVDRDFGLLCVLLAVATMLARLLPLRGSEFSSRLSIYMAGVCAVYVMLGDSRFEAVEYWHINTYMMVLAIFLVVAIRLTRRAQFRTTPLDLLIMFFVVTVVVISGLSAESAARYRLADAAIWLAVYFYSSEFLSSRDRQHNRVLPYAAVVSLGILATRGLF